MQRCDIFNAQSVALDLQKFERICSELLKAEGINGSLNIVFIDEDRMKEYNTYRHANGPTDVLSFESDLPNFLGEVYVCPSYVQQNATYFHVKFEEELLRVCIHGILHLLGYDHERNEKEAKKMFQKQEYYVSTFCDSFDSNS